MQESQGFEETHLLLQGVCKVGDAYTRCLYIVLYCLVLFFVYRTLAAHPVLSIGPVPDVYQWRPHAAKRYQTITSSAIPPRQVDQ